MVTHDRSFKMIIRAKKEKSWGVEELEKAGRFRDTEVGNFFRLTRGCTTLHVPALWCISKPSRGAYVDYDYMSPDEV